MVKVMYACVCFQTGERICVAIKTCKDRSADVKEKFLSEASEYSVRCCCCSDYFLSKNLQMHIPAHRVWA